MKRSGVTCGIMLALLTAPAAWGGPAEVNGLRGQLQAIDAEIRATEQRLHTALLDRSGVAGDEGTRLRTLKRERERLKQALTRATAAERQRESGPSATTTLTAGTPAASDAPAADP